MPLLHWNILALAFIWLSFGHLEVVEVRHRVAVFEPLNQLILLMYIELSLCSEYSNDMILLQVSKPFAPQEST